MRYTAALLSLLALAVSAWADFTVPEQKIVGAEKIIPADELVDLTLSPIRNHDPALAGVSYAWKVFDLSTGYEKKTREDDKGVFFVGGNSPRKFKAVCAATYLFLDKQAGKTSVRTVILTADVVVIGEPTPGPSPGPSPTPTPTPGPGPSLPDGRFKLAGFAYETANSQVTNQTARSKGARAIAEGLSSVASAIVAGAIRTPEDALKEASGKITSSLKEEGVTTDWKGFSKSLQEQLFSLYQSGQLKSAGDFGDAFLELAEGLGKVR